MTIIFMPPIVPKMDIYGTVKQNRAFFNESGKRDSLHHKIICVRTQKQQKYKAKKQRKGEPMLKTNTFYKAKKTTPGGYFYIKEVNDGKVTFEIVETPTASALKGNNFTVAAKDIFNLIECEYIAN